ncbi:MAG: ABC transporter ATP-binding protein, partial [Spirochaetaceae bacterium]|nr:ABC transporter ATP-binding protein [Spirochaetaceae bacterium]
VELGLRSRKIPKLSIADKVRHALIATGIAAKADFPARFLSGGEKRRLAVAGILALDADIIIFDEPYANLDYPGIVSINTLLVQLKTTAKTIIILTHELEKCLALANRLVVLHKGGVVFSGTPEDALTYDLGIWGIHNPLEPARSGKDLVWL